MDQKYRIVIGYPPLQTSKGTPLLGQNRQFQYFSSPTYIYPMVPAFAATLSKQAGYEVNWLDGIAEKKTFQEWEKELWEYKPDFLLLETKAPVVKQHWKIIENLKSRDRNLKIILVGDHVTAFPLESFKNCPVDYVIAGGDYDFVLVNLLNHISKGSKLEGGVYWRVGDKLVKSDPAQIQDQIANSGPMALTHQLDQLPFIDRDLTRWELYAYENGNYKYTPGTYVYSGRDCWWNRCTFCVWAHTMNPPGTYRSFSPQRLFDEIKYLVDNYHVKEIFDDAGTIFVGPKLRQFCQLMIDSGYSQKVIMGCNMRFNALTPDDCKLMKQAGFRFVLYGMESANQKTLDRLDKGLKVEEIARGAQMASKAGLEVHATVMLGYPWESYEDAAQTISLARECFDKGYFHTMQATIVIPYPGTPLWEECKKNGWLKTEDYDDYDMRAPVMTTPLTDAQLMKLTQELYSAFFTPRFIIRKVLSVRSWSDIKFFMMAAKKLAGHLLDFDASQAGDWTNPRFWSHSLKAFGTHLLRKKEKPGC